MRATGSHWRRAALIVGVILGGVIVARAFGLAAYLRFENLSRLTETIEGYGALGPAIYIAAYVLGVVFFVPGLPMTLLGGLAFGPVRGAAYVWNAATIGAALAFLVARYGLRGLVEGWVAQNARLARIDEAVAREGWRIVMITRLVPLFPFNLQNYTYGVTRIGFWAYLGTSAVCIIPATVAYTFAGGALSRGGGNLRWTLGYLGVAGVLIVLVSLIPRYLERRSRAAGALKRAILLPVLVALGVGPPPVHAGAAAYGTLVASNLPRDTSSTTHLPMSLTWMIEHAAEQPWHGSVTELSKIEGARPLFRSLSSSTVKTETALTFA
jgi:uncharacterized membrane protein YdjX (TVP38/TMEM64 family)